MANQMVSMSNGAEGSVRNHFSALVKTLLILLFRGDVEG